MVGDTPLATVRLASDNLNSVQVDHIIFQSKTDLNQLTRADALENGLEVRNEPGVWFATTEGFSSYKAKDHLLKLIDLISFGLPEIRALFPDINVSFSLLSFAPNLRAVDLPDSLISYIGQLGKLEIELPAEGKEFVMNNSTIGHFAA